MSEPWRWLSATGCRLLPWCAAWLTACSTVPSLPGASAVSSPNSMEWAYVKPHPYWLERRGAHTCSARTAGVVYRMARLWWSTTLASPSNDFRPCTRVSTM